MRLRALVLAGAAFALAAPAFGDIVNVYVFDFDYSTDPTHNQIIDPTIHVGDTVHWIFEDEDHTVTSAAGQAESFNSGFPPNGLPFTFDHTFTHTGTFWYYCQMHGFDNGNGTAGGMAGIVKVQPVPEPASMAALGLGAIGVLARRKKR